MNVRVLEAASGVGELGTGTDTRVPASTLRLRFTRTGFRKSFMKAGDHQSGSPLSLRVSAG